MSNSASCAVGLWNALVKLHLSLTAYANALKLAAGEDSQRIPYHRMSSNLLVSSSKRVTLSAAACVSYIRD